MITEEDEYTVLFSGLENLSCDSRLGLVCLVTLHHSHEGLRGNISTLVVNVAISVDILSRNTGSGRLVEDFPLEWVARVVSNVIVEQGNNVALGDAVLLQELDSITRISLVAIVSESIGSSGNDCPVGSRSEGGYE